MVLNKIRLYKRPHSYNNLPIDLNLGVEPKEKKTKSPTFDLLGQGSSHFSGQGPHETI
jgi:hypothetical protein